MFTNFFDVCENNTGQIKASPSVPGRVTDPYTAGTKVGAHKQIELLKIFC